MSFINCNRLGNNIIDEKGKRYGKWFVLERDVTKLGKRRAYWICRCDCGNQSSVNGYTLRNGGSKQCKSCHLISLIANLIGKRFGRWTVVARDITKLNRKHIFWHAICDCGNKKSLTGHTLKKRRSTQCNSCRIKERQPE